jgi:hypothetical protein
MALPLGLSSGGLPVKENRAGAACLWRQIGKNRKECNKS